MTETLFQSRNEFSEGDRINVSGGKICEPGKEFKNYRKPGLVRKDNGTSMKINRYHMVKGHAYNAVIITSCM